MKASFIGISIIIMRFKLPESPRWLVLHGYTGEADKLVTQIEERIEKEKGVRLLPVEQQQRFPVTHGSAGFGIIISKMLTTYRKRSILGNYIISSTLCQKSLKGMFQLFNNILDLGLCLMISQAFFYNAIFFTYATILTTYYGVLPEYVGIFELPFCIGNILLFICLLLLLFLLSKESIIFFRHYCFYCWTRF
jgi:hypothetical protein